MTYKEWNALPEEQQKQATYYEPSIKEEPIGSYGIDWMNWMKEHEPRLVKKLQTEQKFLTIARSVDAAAWDYYGVLQDEYYRNNRQPDTYEENVAYCQAMLFEVDSIVMRETVCVKRSEP